MESISHDPWEREWDAGQCGAGLDNPAQTLGQAVADRQASGRAAVARALAKMSRSWEAIERSQAALQREEARQQRRGGARREHTTH